MSEDQDNKKSILEEAIRLELNVSRIYKKFFEMNEDTGFWWRLMVEEKNHASILMSARDSFIEILPREFLPENLEILIQANQEIEELANNSNIPSRAERFKIALELEESAGEIHFQKIMEQNSENKILCLFQKLNADDKNHAERIRQYMSENNIF